MHLFNYGFLYPIFYFGWSGVDLFFVLSGFLITGILLDTKHNKGYYKTFLIRRAFRILPLYYGVLLVFAFVAPYSNITSWFKEYQIYFWTHTSNFLFLQKGFFRPLGHLWSLAIEEQFYILWPLIVWALNPKQLIVFSFMLIALGVLLRSYFTNPYLTFGLPLAHMDGVLSVGILAVLIRHKEEFLFKHIDKLFAVCSFILIAYVSIYIWVRGTGSKALFYRLPFTFTLISFFFGSLLVISLKHAWLAKSLSNRLLLFFGKYSYGMYIYNSIFFYYSNWAGVDRLSENKKLFAYSGVFAVTIIASYLSYNLFEVKFLRMKERFTNMPMR